MCRIHIVATGATSYEQTLEMTFNVFQAAGDLESQT